MKKTNNYNDEYIFSTDKEKLDLDTIFNFISNSYWGNGTTKNIIKKTIDNSFCFGVYHENKQIGFARIVTDFAVFGYIADVFILEEYQGKGIGKRLVEFIISHPDIKRIRRLLLATKDAHGLYKKYGFEPIEELNKYLTVLNTDAYKHHE